MERNDKKIVAAFIRPLRFMLLLAALSACRPGNKPKIDEFYTQKGEWDSARIPFLKPYEAIITSEEYGWCMNLLPTDSGNSMLSNIRKAAVERGFILIYTGRTMLSGSEIKESWWIVSPSRKIQKGFSNHAQYLAYLKTLGFQNEPRVYKMEVVASYYEDHETMDWRDLSL